MKKTILTLALAGTFGVVAAQSMVTSIPSAKPTVTSTAVAAAPAPSAPAAGTAANAANPARPDPHVNPFNGKLQSVEQLQRDLEQARMQTQVLEEQLKQTSLNEELKAVPVRKAVEVAQAVTATKKEEVNQKELEAALRAPKVTAAIPAAGGSKPISVKKAAPVRTVKPATTSTAATTTSQAPASAAAAAPRPTLVSIMDVGGSRSVVLEFGGATMVVADGDSTPFGTVKVRDQNSADIGGNHVRVHSATMARFIVSDAKAVATLGSQVQSGAAAVGTPPPAPVVTATANFTGPAPAMTASPLGLPAQANGPLPALPLPPSTPAMAAPTSASPAMPGAPVQGQGQPQAYTLPPGVSILPAPAR